MSDEIERLSLIREAKINVDNLVGIAMKAHSVYKNAKQDQKDAIFHLNQVMNENLIEDSVSLPLFTQRKEPALPAIGQAPSAIETPSTIETPFEPEAPSILKPEKDWRALPTREMANISPVAAEILVAAGLTTVGEIFDHDQKGGDLRVLDAISDVMATEVEDELQWLLDDAGNGDTLLITQKESSDPADNPPPGTQLAEEILGDEAKEQEVTPAEAASESSEQAETDPVAESIDSLGVPIRSIEYQVLLALMHNEGSGSYWKSLKSKSDIELTKCISAVLGDNKSYVGDGYNVRWKGDASPSVVISDGEDLTTIKGKPLLEMARKFFEIKKIAHKTVGRPKKIDKVAEAVF